MSSNLKKVIKLKTAQQKIVMLEGWKELTQVKKREAELDEQRVLLESQYSSLNTQDGSYLGAELSELAIRQAGYLSMTLKTVRDECTYLSEKHQKIDREVILANAKAEAFGDLGKSVCSREHTEKLKANMESELVEATGRSLNDANK